MKEAFIILAIITVAHAAGGLAPGLRVKFDMGTNPGETFFFKLPRTVAEANEAGWKRTCRPVGDMPELDMYCSSDLIVCVLMDDTDYVAGLQISIPLEKVRNNIFDWVTRGFTFWTTYHNGQYHRFWTIQQYFVSHDTFKKSKEERIASRDPTRTLQERSVWLTGTNRRLLEISTDETDVKQSIFTEQACLPWMGKHYYFNMSETTACSADQLYPWFVMTYNGETAATGFMSFLDLDIDAGERDWFEHPDSNTVRAIVPRGPQCLYGLPTLTMHIYYVDEPWSITC